MVLPITPRILNNPLKFMRPILDSFTKNESWIVHFLRQNKTNTVVGYEPGTVLGSRSSRVFLDKGSGPRVVVRDGQHDVEKLFKNGWLEFEPDGKDERAYFWLTDHADEFLDIVMEEIVRTSRR